MDWLISTAAAQAQNAAQGPANPLMSPSLWFLPLMFVVFYFLLIRPQTKRAKEHRAMIAALEVGAEVVTNGGILGKVTQIGEQYLTLEIADGVNVKIQRATVSQVLAQGHAEEPLTQTPHVSLLPLEVLARHPRHRRRHAVRAAERVRRGPGAAVVAQRSRGDGRGCAAARARRSRGCEAHPGGFVPRRRTGWCCGSSSDEAARRRATSIIKGTKGDYLVALSSVPRAPEWMRKVGLKPMSLGLDLRGGVHFVYEVDVQGALAQAVERMERDARTQLRDSKPRVAYGAVTSNPATGVVRVVLRNASDLQAAMDALKAPDGSLQLTSGEAADGTYVEMRMTPAGAQAPPGRRHRAEHHDAAQSRR